MLSAGGAVIFTGSARLIISGTSMEIVHQLCSGMALRNGAMASGQSGCSLSEWSMITQPCVELVRDGLYRAKKDSPLASKV